jgi:hypothetical protein
MRSSATATRCKENEIENYAPEPEKPGAVSMASARAYLSQALSFAGGKHR